MEVDYSYKVKEVYKKTKENFIPETNAEDMKSSIMKELLFFENFIPQFFSYGSCGGEAKNITNMYKQLQELDYTRNRVIPVIDVNLGAHVYMEYFTGMREFIDSVIKVVRNNDTEKLDTIKKQIEVAKNGDELFINSIFGGKNNETKNETITDAVGNVEFLIDFVDIIKTMKLNVESAFGNAGETFENPFVKDMVILMLKSMSYYCYRTLLTIFDTYRNIIDTLNGTSKDVAESVTFKLF